MVENARETVSEVPANGTDSARGDYLPMVEAPAGHEEELSASELEANISLKEGELGHQ